MIEITADFNIDDLNATIQNEVDEWFDELLEIYRKAGRKFTERARARTKLADGSFGNITWNLRSSIGYLLVNNGVVLESYFPALKGAPEGSKTGDDYAREIALLIDEGEGVALVCVAGMEYAFFVESKGFDVITVSSLKFETEIKELLAA